VLLLIPRMFILCSMRSVIPWARSRFLINVESSQNLPHSPPSIGVMHPWTPGRSFNWGLPCLTVVSSRSSRIVSICLGFADLGSFSRLVIQRCTVNKKFSNSSLRAAFNPKRGFWLSKNGCMPSSSFYRFSLKTEEINRARYENRKISDHRSQFRPSWFWFPYGHHHDYFWLFLQ